MLTVGAKFVFRGNACRRRSGGKIGKYNLTKGRIGGIIGAYGAFAVRLYAIYEWEEIFNFNPKGEKI